MQDHDISVLTGDADHNTAGKLPGIQTGIWTAVITLPDQRNAIQVLYMAKEKITRRFFSSVLNEKQPDVIYLNGIFSFRFVLVPLMTADAKKVKIVLCPRGMLQSGALAGKSLKKKIYLRMLSLSGLVKNISWHATNNEEADDIRKIFGSHAKIITAGNIPRRPYEQPAATAKKQGALRLVYISLIATKKNLLQLIELVNRSEGINLDIYGPVKDKDYWQHCLPAIAASQGRVQYKGDLQPQQVQDTFCKYDASVLLTKGENFGHALYESLSVGRPVITSYFTPWNELEKKAAGWNLDIASDDACLQKLASICSMNKHMFADYCKGAHETASVYFAGSSGLDNYRAMFTN